MTISFSQSNYSSFNNETGFYDGAVYHYNGSTYTLETDNANMDYFDDTASVGDALIFRMSANGFKFPNQLRFNVGTAIAGTGLTLKWYVGTHTSKITGAGYPEIDWLDITSYVTDNTNGFTTTGVNTVDFATYVMERVCAGKFTSITTANATWLKCEIDTLTTITEGGANTTDAVRSQYNRCTVSGGYDFGTTTSQGTYYFDDTSKSWATNELMGRHVWFYDSDASPKIFPILSNTSTRVYLGSPLNLSPVTKYNYFDTNPTTGDSYLILYTFEDLLTACNTAGYDWIQADVYQPRNQDYRNYTLNCEVYINAGSTSVYAGVGTLAKNINFFYGHRYFTNNTYYNNNIVADGMRMRKRNSTDTAFTDSDKITGYGSNFYFNGHGVSTYSMRYNGFLYGSRFHNASRYSFVTYFYLSNVDVRNCFFENCQLGDGTDTTGWNLWHSPVAEPLRVPANTFTVKNFQADGPSIYQTSGATRTLDSPASDEQYPFTCYTSFQTPYRVEIIDKEPTTLKNFRYGGASSTNDSGTFALWYRVNIKVVDKDNNPIQGATIIVYNKNFTQEFTDTTDANGETTDEYWDTFDNVTNKVLESEHYHKADGSGGTKYDFTEINYNPMTIIVKKEGYTSIVQTMTIDKPEYLTFKLTKSPYTRK